MSKEKFAEIVNGIEHPIEDISEAVNLLNRISTDSPYGVNVDLRYFDYDNLQSCSAEGSILTINLNAVTDTGEICLVSYKMHFDRLELKAIQNYMCIVVYSKEQQHFHYDEKCVVDNGDYVVIHDKSQTRNLHRYIK